MSNSWSSLDNEIEKKSKLFLNRIIGEDNFNKLQKDGKIEFEVNNKSNEKILYELYDNGKIINKTKNQSYCIVPDKCDYPIDDVVAIKYAYLIHGNEIAEKVANRSSLVSSYIRGTSPSYLDYVDYMNQNGWFREKIIIDEKYSFNTEMRNIQKNETNRLIEIVCPVGNKLTIMGTQQVPIDSQINTSYSIILEIKNENGIKIPDRTKIRITKGLHSEFVRQIGRYFYSDFKGYFRFTQGIEISNGQYLTFYIVDPKVNIPKENIKFKIEADLWTKE